MRLKDIDPNAEYSMEDVADYIYMRDNNLCLVCGKAGDAQIHHIKFRSRLGKNIPNNLALLCCKCHDSLHHGKLKGYEKALTEKISAAVFRNEKRFRKRLT